MAMTFSNSPSAAKAWELVTKLQKGFAGKLSNLAEGKPFSTNTWLREGGLWGGGHRLIAPQDSLFNRGSINVSHVHYTNAPHRRLNSATALSTIIHPVSPLMPSVHIHISWTEMKEGQAYWRIMADLNPSIPDDEDKESFAQALKEAAGPWNDQARQQGDRYFYIPSLARHRGIIHFYLEQHATDDANADFNLALSIGTAATEAYIKILARWLNSATTPTKEQLAQQLSYHTLYFFQVLTLDRGTTSGLLVHDENDVGIMGSLPARVDPQLLKSWEYKVPAINRPLIQQLISCLPETGEVGDSEKKALASIVRSHFRSHPEALELQARGDTLPPTVTNHM